MPGILNGIRVLDFGRFIAGPFAAALLADLGAEVIRIERPAGGEDRFLMTATAEGEGAMFLQANRSKESLGIDLDKPAGAAVILRLIAEANVVVANLSPGALRHLGLDYETLRAIKPDIILTTVSAFGSHSALADRIGFDGTGQAISGATYLTGEPGHPHRSATSYVDYSTAIASAYGTLAAIINWMRTGEGMHVETSLAGTALNIMNPILIEQATGALVREPTGNRSPISGPSDLFAAKDGWLVVQVIGQGMFVRWTRLVGRPELLDDPRFANDALRGRNGAELSRIMGEWTAMRSLSECLSVLEVAKIPASPMLRPADIIGGALGLAKDHLLPVAYPGTDGVPIARPLVRMSDGSTDEVRPPPRAGEHTNAILARFGFQPREIDRLRSDGVI